MRSVKRALLPVVVIAASAAAQQPTSARIDFSGHWVQQQVPVMDANGNPGRPPTGSAVGSFGNDFIIEQDAGALRVRRLDTTYGDTLSNTYRLDGSDSHNPGLFGAGRNPGPAVTTAKWVGDTLVLTGNGAFIGGGSRTGTTTTRLWIQGKQMRMRTERPGIDGAEGPSLLAIFNKKK